jgi:hypothetical protein
VTQTAGVPAPAGDSNNGTISSISPQEIHPGDDSSLEITGFGFPNPAIVVIGGFSFLPMPSMNTTLNGPNGLTPTAPVEDIIQIIIPAYTLQPGTYPVLICNESNVCIQSSQDWVVIATEN